MAAKQFGISKSTVHKDVTTRLKYVNKELFAEMSKLLEKNKSERHLRGGMATKQRYLALSMIMKITVDNTRKML